MVKFCYLNCLLVAGLLMSAPALAEEPTAAETAETEVEESKIEGVEEIIVVGSRRKDGRSQVDTLVPVDVISGEDFMSQGATDLGSLIANMIPSYNINQQPINDAATLVRPAQLRGLPPDSTLVLINGKRRHRASVITFLGNGVADGSQGPDVSVIPAIAIKRAEVLRDGAAAQYGSDAIAGVINFELKDADEGGTLEARWGQYYKGDGNGLNLSGNVGLPLTRKGFANLSFEYKQSDPTDRSQQRSDAQVLVDAGNPHIEDPDYDSVFHPNVMVWGAPKFEDDFKFFANAGIDLNNDVDVYGYANYAKRKVEGGFFFRNPHTRKGVFRGDTDDTVKVVDLDGLGTGGSCPTIRIIDNVASADDIAAVEANPNCESFITRFPGGFVPRFGGNIEDYSSAFGVRTQFANDWDVDLSGVHGQHRTTFFMRHTVNPQLLAKPEITVANIPTDYTPGTYTETDYTVNLDVSKTVNVMFLHSPLNVAFGLEHRQEKFKVTQGGENSWFQDLTPGGLTEQGSGVGSNGFTGFGPRLAGTWSRTSYAAYLDMEAELTQDVLLGAAGRYEDHEDVGETTDFKLSSRGQITRNFAVRGAISTGFRAPTVGQANILNVTTAFTNGKLADEATLPPTHPASALVGGKPLTPEKSMNYAIGTVIDLGKVGITVDYFHIKIKDRIARSSKKELGEDDKQTLIDQGVTDAANFSQLRFYTNDFNTTTQGIDIIATYPARLFGGNTNFSLAGNWTNTTVDSYNPDVIDEKRVIQLEQNLPQTRLTLSANHLQGPWNFLGRVRFYGEFTEFAADNETARLDAEAKTLVDIEGSYAFGDGLGLTLVAGVENILNTYPSKQTANDGNVSGLVYAETSPYGFNGGFYYLRALWNF